MERSSNSLTVDPTAGRWMRLLTREEFVRYLGVAIEATLVQSGGRAPAEARSLRLQVLRTFFARVQARSKRIRGIPKEEFLRQLQRSHAQLLGERERLMAEADEVRGQLALARAGTWAQGFDEEQERALDAALSADLEPLLTTEAARAELPRLLERERLRRRAVVTRLVEEQDRHIDVLERRLAKMRVELAQMEDNLAELARRAAIDPGVASIYKSVQGLDPFAQDRERKAELLSTIFQENLALQKGAAQRSASLSLALSAAASPA